MGRWRIGILSVLAMALAAPAAQAAELPWVKDVAMFRAALPELNRGGVKALGPHVAQFEAALENGRQFFPDGVVVDDKRYVLADGGAEAMMIRMKAAIDKAVKPDTLAVMTADNPYPLIATTLASYYNETGKPEDAIRVLDIGLALSPDAKAGIGDMIGGMTSEKAVALDSLKRYSEALEVYQQGLANKARRPPDRARLLRGEGYVLTELNRLDEAEAAYRESLTLDPNNPGAMGEIAYIGRLRAGAAAQPSIMVLPPGAPVAVPQAPQQPEPASP